MLAGGSIGAAFGTLRKDGWAATVALSP